MLTTAMLAAKVGVSPRRLLQIAGARGVQPAMTLRGAKLWAPAAAKLLKPGKRGRPRKVAP